MAVSERDPVTGRSTTGHDWNGIKELDTPVPRIVFFFLAVTALIALIYWVLMPAWPLGLTYTRGLLGIDQRTTVTAEVAEAASARAGWATAVTAGDFAAVAADDGLMRIVREAGQTLFGDNCAVCHGLDAGGGPGFPNLAAAPFLWGGAAETVAETLRVGINSHHPETRASEMPAFGRDGILGEDEIRDVALYVRRLGQREDAIIGHVDSVQAGAEIFAATCAGCHGDDGRGNSDLGAPDLADGFWIHGGSREAIAASISGGRRGHMPHWEGRLSLLERNILTLYVLDLRAEAAE